MRSLVAIGCFILAAVAFGEDLSALRARAE